MKKILLAGILTVASFLGINSVSALTKNDVEQIKRTYFEMGCYFTEEDKMPTTQCLRDNLVGITASYDDSPYLISEDEFEDEEGNPRLVATYRVPAEIFEDYINERFFVIPNYISKFREDFQAVDGYDYKEIDGKYYYEFEYDFFLGGYGSASYFDVKGYKDLGNNYYEFYFHEAIDYGDYVPSSNDVLGDDYINIEGDNLEVIYGYKFKIYYTEDELKIASRIELEKDEIPKRSELILCENLSDEEVVKLEFIEKTTKFDATKDKALSFKIEAEFDLFDKVYVDGKEVDKKMYEAKSGSTVISFKEEYIKTLTNGEHTFKTTFTDGSSAETKFTVENSTVGQAVKNPVTGLFAGLGLMGLVGAASAGAYVTIKRKNKFPKA